MKYTFVAVVLSWLVAGPVLAQTAGSPPSPGDAERFSVSAEALLWWFKENAAPPLVTDGLFGEPGTKVLLGGRTSTPIRTPASGWPRATRRRDLGSGGQLLLRATALHHRSVSSSGQPGSTDLWVTFIDPNIPAESLTELSAAGFFAGSATEELRNSLMGAELNGTAQLPAMGSFRLEALGGFRYLRLKETYTFSTNSPNIPPNPADVFQTTDQFETTNNFYGPQVGGRGRADWGGLFLSGAVKVGLGAMVQSVDIDGQLVTNDFNNFGPCRRSPAGTSPSPPTSAPTRAPSSR